MTDTHASSGRKQVREPVKAGPVELRLGEYRGRNGEILKRSTTKPGNKYEIPAEAKEDGWSYQWITHSIYNNTEYSELSVMKHAGWREVNPVSGCRGYFREQTPEGQNHVWMEGLILVERPQGMTDDARREAKAVADRQLQGQIHKIYDETAQLPSGFKPMRGEFDRDAPEAAPQSWKPQHRPRQPVAVEE